MSFRQSTVNKFVTLSIVAMLGVSCSPSRIETTASASEQQQGAALSLSPSSLKVGEGFENPLGYYEAAPRFSWKIASDASTQFQSAYQIQVATSADILSQAADLWDSNKVQSEVTSWVKYQGQALRSRQKVYWRVRIWDEADKASQWSEVQSVELGLLTNQDWQAKWIGHPDTDLTKKPSQAVLATPQYLRKTFSVAGEIKQARLYITAKGLFKPFINGSAVSLEDVMTPGWTPYAKRIETLTYDLTSSLKQGENAISASLAGGWYAGRVYEFTDREFALPARLLAQLEITYANGKTQQVVTDESWFTSQQGPIRFASIYDGERYEQGKEMPWLDDL
ncbi:alpha-L-rhamnosidase N-terminal domain-containing protein [Paraglaciecola aquimarina]|uniref:Alpha-L-rhamnosidase N-terminal domain-containing protein n=1 Tax=Paraglaciecola aquimarina TaxID=1235557 RepID=A0ABU3SRD8_9ALTE|nr:alpha-L-rhamnosidase N-terminal domain-containing protein [Paraglaciecola aquimarina]MDU0352567.1 alpha-L-rhamnosidase N-terminal domain-containing protein [Paraglaciecola aquimarina]